MGLGRSVTRGTASNRFGRGRANYRISQDPNALHEWVDKQRERFGNRKIAIAIEQRRGAVVYALMTYDFVVLYPINPKSLAKFREALRPSKAKDDPTDADLLLELVTKHRDRLRAWNPEDEAGARASDDGRVSTQCWLTRGHGTPSN